MSSQETPGASSSRGTAIPLEATAGTGNLGNRIEDVDIAFGQPTADDFKLAFFQEIDDPEGDYKVQVLGWAAPQHDLPNPPVPDLASQESELYKEITREIIAGIIDQFYEARFQQLEIAKPHACEDDLEDYYTIDDDDSSYAI